MAMLCVGARVGAIQAQYKVISGPPGGHQILHYIWVFHRNIDIGNIGEYFQQHHKTWELWSTYEKWRFQLFAGHNPRTNSGPGSVIQCYPGLKPENRVIISYYLQCVLLKKINITVLSLSSNVCILFAFVEGTVFPIYWSYNLHEMTQLNFQEYEYWCSMKILQNIKIRLSLDGILRVLLLTHISSTRSPSSPLFRTLPLLFKLLRQRQCETWNFPKLSDGCYKNKCAT